MDSSEPDIRLERITKRFGDMMGLNVMLQRRLAARSLRLDAVEEPETAALVPARG